MDVVEVQAREALAAADENPDWGMEQAMRVLACAPGHAEMHALVRRCGARACRPSERPEVRYAFDCLLHAHAEQYEEALVALLLTVEALPDRDWLRWCVPWLERIPDERLPLKQIFYYLAGVMQRFPNVVRHRESERAALRRVFPLLDALAPRLGTNEMFLVFASALTRKAADGEHALRYAQQGLAVAKTYDTVLTLATCHRFLGNTDEALALLSSAAELDESSRAVMERDMGLALEEAGRYEEALAQMERNDPRDRGTNINFVRWRSGRPVDEVWAPLFATFPADLTADEVYAAAHLPHVGWIVPPTDATLQALMKSERGAELIACSSDVEAPSVWLAARLHLGVEMSGVTLLDGADLSLVEPRPGGVALWEYRYARDAAGYLSLESRAARLSEPSTATREVVEQLASSWYSLPRWWGKARALAPAIPSSRELAAMMTWVGSAPEAISAWEWVQRVQRASALLLAQREDGWELLCGIALGTPDWSVGAAVLALTELALDRPERLLAVRGLFLQLAAQSPAALRTSEEILVDCALRLPDWTRTERDDWQARKPNEETRA